MKIALVLAAAMIAGLGTDNGHAKESSKMRNVNASVVVMKPAKEVWQSLAKIDGLEKILPSMLTETHIEGGKRAELGCVRVCKAHDGSITREKVVRLDEHAMIYAYEFVEGVPAKMTNSFQVVPLGEAMSKVIWNSDYEYMENPMMNTDQFYNYVSMAGQKIVDDIRTRFSN